MRLCIYDHSCFSCICQVWNKLLKQGDMPSVYTSPEGPGKHSWKEWNKDVKTVLRVGIYARMYNDVWIDYVVYEYILKIMWYEW